MACNDKPVTTSWRVIVVSPRASAGEVNLYLRARRIHDGRQQEQRLSSGTTERPRAQLEAARFEAELNGEGCQSLAGIMDARIADLERAAARGTKSQESVTGFRSARARIAQVLDGVWPIDRPTLLCARDRLSERLGPEAVNTYLRRAAACWRWAEERGLVSTPWPRIKPLEKPPRSKRPYTPIEVEDVLAWARTYESGRWAPILELIAETGRRVSEVCRLRGRDIDRQALVVRVVQKGRRTLVLPVSADVMALVPPAAPSAYVFPSRGDKRTGGRIGPARRDTVLRVIKRAVVALKIADGERLDLHSLRRSLAADGHEARLPDDAVAGLTGHESKAMLAHYRRDAVGRDKREALEVVRGYRSREAAKARAARAGATSTESSHPPETGAGQPTEAAAPHGAMRSRTSDLVLIRASDSSAHNTTIQGDAPYGQVERGARPGPRARRSSPFRASGADADIALAIRWADESPSTMRRVLRDQELAAQLLAALDAEAPEDEGATAQSGAR